MDCELVLAVRGELLLEGDPVLGLHVVNSLEIW